MHAIIDVASDVGAVADRLAAAGVETVIRYYNHRNSTALPSKCLTRPERDALHRAGLAVAVVFQQRGGAGGAIEDFDAENGARDAARALALAEGLGQPHGSAIYFAVDWDFADDAALSRIGAHFDRIRTALDGRFAVGVYGSGLIGTRLLRDGLADHVWLAWDTTWSGTRAALADGSWSLFQSAPHLTSAIGGFGYDGNVANPAIPDFGASAATG